MFVSRQADYKCFVIVEWNGMFTPFASGEYFFLSSSVSMSLILSISAYGSLNRTTIGQYCRIDLENKRTTIMFLRCLLNKNSWAQLPLYWYDSLRSGWSGLWNIVICLMSIVLTAIVFLCTFLLFPLENFSIFLFDAYFYQSHSVCFISMLNWISRINWIFISRCYESDVRWHFIQLLNWPGREKKNYHE